MTTLTSIPPELLGQILSYSSVDHKVLELWKCGNTRLNLLIVNGCTRVSLEDKKWHSTSRFPKMLHQLRRLKHLSIIRSPTLRFMESDDLGRELQLLSPTLESLELECCEAESCLLRPVDNVDWMFSEPSYSNESTPSDEEVSSEIETRMWSLSKVFPLLASLTLNCAEPSLVASDIRELPETLTYLKLAAAGSYRVHNNCENLPRGLQSLIFRESAYWSVSHIRTLPPTLTRFSQTPDLLNPMIEEWSAFPKTITSLSLVEIPINLPILRALPPLLKELCVSELRIGKTQFGVEPEDPSAIKSWPLLLPRSLTSIKFANFAMGSASPVDFGLFPKTITHLQLPMFNWKLSAQHPVVFPTALKTFITTGLSENDSLPFGELPQNAALQEFSYTFEALPDFTKLPRTLTSLTLTGNSTIFTSIPADLPASLTKLDTFASRYGMLDPAGISSLPRGLKHLNMKFSRYPTAEETLQWPPYLENAKLFVNEEVSTSPIFRLPTTLRVLVLITYPTLLKAEHFALLPRGLEALDYLQRRDPFMGGASPLAKASTSTSNQGPPWTPTDPSMILSSLPPTLRRLSFTISYPHLPDCLERLPPHLTTLSILLKHLEDKHVKMLPRTLRFSNFRDTPSKLSPYATSMFPPHLEMFYLDGKDRSPEFDAFKLFYDSAPIATPDPRILRK